MSDASTMRSLTPAEKAALDRPIWSALTTGHRSLALGGPLALRYPRGMTPFAAVAESTPAAFDALRALIPEGDQVAFFTIQPPEAPNGFETYRVGEIHQMVATSTPDADRDDRVANPLGAADAAEMLRLAELTKPGPFGPRTWELGGFMGIRERGALVAMAGERMRLDGLVEVSGICVHPDARGRGHARKLTIAVMRAIAARGAIPFLHVFVDNEPAIALYRRLGFEIRQRAFVTRLWPRSAA